VIGYKDWEEFGDMGSFTKVTCKKDTKKLFKALPQALGSSDDAKLRRLLILAAPAIELMKEALDNASAYPVKPT